MSAVFEARYNGHCAADCGESVKAGDPVRFLDDELVHADCERVRRRIPEVVCTSCWLTKPCECDD